MLLYLNAFSSQKDRKHDTAQSYLCLLGTYKCHLSLMFMVTVMGLIQSMLKSTGIFPTDGKTDCASSGFNSSLCADALL